MPGRKTTTTAAPNDGGVDLASLYAPTLVYIMVLIVAGIVGNTIVFFVYYRRFQPSVTRYYILAMSVVDFLANVISLPMEFVFRVVYDVDYGPFCRINGAAKSFLVVLSAFILVAVALDRYWAICRPSRRKTTSGRTKRTLWMCVGAAMVGSVPMIVLIGKQTFHLPGTNVTGSTCFVADEFVDSLYLDVYKGLTLTLFAVCVTVMGVSYSLVGRKLWLHRKKILSGSSTTLTARAIPLEVITRPNSGSGRDPARDADLAAAVSSSKRAADPTEEEGNAKRQSTTSQRSTTNNNPVKISSCFSRVSVFVHNVFRGASAERRGEEDSEQDAGNDLVEVASGFTSQASGHEDEAEPEDESGPEDVGETQELGEMGDSDGAPACAGPGLETATRQTRFTQVRRPNLAPAKSVKRAPSRRPGNRAWKVKKIPRRTTLMMFVLTAVFVLNFLPYLVTVVVYEGRDMINTGRLGLNLYHLAQRSYFINSAVNPLVYGFCSESFRRQCRLLFHCKGAS